MGEIRVKLKQFLDDNGVTTYRLANGVRGASPKTVYAIAKGDRKPSLEVLGELVGALRELTGREVTPADLLEYVPAEQSKLSASGLPYTGDRETDSILDDPEMVARILSHKKELAGLSLDERRQKREQARQRGELVSWREVKERLDRA